MTWRAEGLAILGRKVSEVDCSSVRVRARVRASRRRVVVDFTMALCSDSAHLALAAAHRLAAHVLEHVVAAEGWCIADPVVRVHGGTARVTVTGAQAAAAVSSFFEGGADVALSRVQ